MIVYTVDKNKKYENKILNEIINNYDIDDVVYYNKTNNYYVIESNSKIIVLNSKYELVNEILISDIHPNDNNYDIVYKNNNLMYREKIVNENTINYNYYDIYTYELIMNKKIGG